MLVKRYAVKKLLFNELMDPVDIENFDGHTMYAFNLNGYDTPEEAYDAIEQWYSNSDEFDYYEPTLTVVELIGYER